MVNEKREEHEYKLQNARTNLFWVLTSSYLDI